MFLGHWGSVARTMSGGSEHLTDVDATCAVGFTAVSGSLRAPFDGMLLTGA